MPSKPYVFQTLGGYQAEDSELRLTAFGTTEADALRILESERCRVQGESAAAGTDGP